VLSYHTTNQISKNISNIITTYYHTTIPYIIHNSHKTILLQIAPKQRDIFIISTKLPRIDKLLQPHQWCLNCILWPSFILFYILYLNILYYFGMSMRSRHEGIVNYIFNSFKSKPDNGFQ